MGNVVFFFVRQLCNRFTVLRKQYDWIVTETSVTTDFFIRCKKASFHCFLDGVKTVRTKIQDHAAYIVTGKKWRNILASGSLGCFPGFFQKKGIAFVRRQFGTINCRWGIFSCIACRINAWSSFQNINT